MRGEEIEVYDRLELKVRGGVGGGGGRELEFPSSVSTTPSGRNGGTGEGGEVERLGVALVLAAAVVWEREA